MLNDVIENALDWPAEPQLVAKRTSNGHRSRHLGSRSFGACADQPALGTVSESRNARHGEAGRSWNEVIRQCCNFCVSNAGRVLR
jgi:hypothetical protein